MRRFDMFVLVEVGGGLEPVPCLFVFHPGQQFRYGSRSEPGFSFNSKTWVRGQGGRCCEKGEWREEEVEDEEKEGGRKKRRASVKPNLFLRASDTRRKRQLQCSG